MRRIRAFLAIKPPQEVLAAVACCAASLRGPLAHMPLAWVPEDCLHVTLKFFGDIEEEAVPHIEERLLQGLAEHPLARPEIVVSGLGAFPTPERPRVLFAGVAGPAGGPPSALLALQRDIEGWLAELRHPEEKRSFHPHVTIARVKGRPKSVASCLALHTQPFGPPAPVREILLYESRPGRSGVEYVSRACVSLTAAS